MKARYFLLALAATALVACQEKDPETPAVKGVLTVSGATNNAVSADAAGRTLNLTVKSNVSWTATSSESWVSVDPSEFASDNKSTVSTKVSVKVAANESADARTAKISIAGEGVDAVEVTVNQAGAVVEAKTINVWDMDKFEALEGYEVSLPYSESEATFVVHANGDWTASAPEWLTVEPASNKFDGNENITVTVKAEKNIGETRKGEIKFTGDFDNELVVPVSQKQSVTFALEVADLTYKTVTMNVTPSDEEIYYTDLCVSKSLFDGKGLDFCLDYTVSYLDQYLAGYTAQDILDGLCFQGEYAITYKDLDPETEYVLLIVGTSYDEAQAKFVTASAPATTNFTTLAAPDPTADYSAFLGDWKANSVDYFNSTRDNNGNITKAVYADFVMHIEEDIINESYKVTFPQNEIAPYTAGSEDNDYFGCTLDESGKAIDFDSFIRGSNGAVWSLNNGAYRGCTIYMTFMWWATEASFESLKFSLADDGKSFALTSPTVPEDDYLTIGGVWFQGATQLGFNGVYLLIDGASFTKVNAASSSVKNTHESAQFHFADSKSMFGTSSKLYKF